MSEQPTYRFDILYGRMESECRERVSGDVTYFEGRYRHIDPDEKAGAWSPWVVISSMTMKSPKPPRWWEFWK